MADCGGLPQVVQVSVFLEKHLELFLSMFLINFFLPQPGKLAEAFKYFVQGMGYSK